MIDQIKEIYNHSMNELCFSGQAKEKMFRVISEQYSEQNSGGKIMKASFSFKTAGIVAAACVMLIGTTVFAGSSIVSSIESHNRIGSEITAYEDMAKLERTISMDVLTVEKFSNGFRFSNAEIIDVSDYNEEGADLADASGVDVIYTKDGMADIYLNAEPVSTLRSYEDTSMETRMVGDVAVKYSLDEYLFLPPSMEGQVSQELIDRMENDDHFFISYGSDQEETQMITNLSFDVDGVHYCLTTFDTTLTVDELFGMAGELIISGK
ncbi:hypothetical protein [Butyrivibrio sp.]|jgi:hypothetical protein|uniref:hypothetical protein n=1 Tax=Butyrivibrio sp. TaxID=28121 RepID=UPI0025BFEE5A|nr:hypothetical protein [Butyrivibrio sp.]MBE5839582.1 hypothetical protein [Butyrivibrio sp.]